MENSKNQKFAGQTPKKTEMPERKREDISSGPKTTRPEIDLPLKGGRAESELSSKTPRKDEKSEFDRSPDRSERSTR